MLQPRGAMKQPTLFFAGLAVLLTGIVALGFAKSLFLRPLFSNFPVAPVVIVHGVVMTAWFLVFLAQAILGSQRRLVAHRRLGWAGTALAVLVVASIIPTTYGFPARRFAADVPGYDVGADLLHITMVVHGNTAMLVLFIGFYVMGLMRRQRPEDHRRLMSFAAIVLVVPAASRLGTVFGEAGVTSQPLGMLAAFGLPLLVAAHDLAAGARLHAVTIAGVTAIYALFGVLGILGLSPLGEALILGLAEGR